MTAIDPRPIADHLRHTRPPATDPFTVESMVAAVLRAIDAAGLTVVDTHDPATVVKVARAVWFSAGGSTKSTALTVLDALR